MSVEPDAHRTTVNTAAATRLSAIVCTRNRSEWAVKAVASLLAQDVPDEQLELIVVDNASTDDTGVLLPKLVAGHPGGRYLLEPELGLSHARNRGILESSGDVVAFLDDDAEAFPGWARHHLESYADGDVVGVAGRIDLGWPQQRPVWLPPRWDGMYAGLDLGPSSRDLDPPAIPYGANMSFRRAALEGDAMFDPNLGRRGNDLISGEEHELFARLRSSGRLVYAPDARVTHHVLPERVSARWFLRRVWAQGRTNVRLATLLRDRRSRLGWLARAGYAGGQTAASLVIFAGRSVKRATQSARMDRLALAVQTAAISKEALRMAVAGAPHSDASS